MVAYERYFGPVGANVGRDFPHLSDQDQSKKQKYRHQIIVLQASKASRVPFAAYGHLRFVAPKPTVDLSAALIVSCNHRNEAWSHDAVIEGPDRRPEGEGE
jgi:hypothetical protein